MKIGTCRVHFDEANPFTSRGLVLKSVETSTKERFFRPGECFVVVAASFAGRTSRTDFFAMTVLADDGKLYAGVVKPCSLEAITE